MSATSGIQASGGASTAAGANAFSALSSDQFVKIIFSELSHQDPLKPNDTSALLQQMSTLRTIQSSIDLSSKLDSLVQQNQFATAGNVIGKTVSGLTEDGRRVRDAVVSISRTAKGPVLNLRTGERVPFDTIDEIADAPPPAVPSGH